MEVLIDSDVLLEGLGRVKPIVSTKGLVPVLNCFILEAENGKFSISASSDDLTMKWALGEDAEYVEKQKASDASSKEETEEGEEGSKTVRKDVLKVREVGKVATLASRFHEIVSKLGGSYKVSLKVDKDQNLIVTCDMADAKATLTRDAAADIDDFPKVEDPEGKEIPLPENFVQMLKLAQIAICEIESRFDLKGMHFKIGKGKVSLTSCDNKKICRASGEIEDDEAEGEFFISREAVKELIRMKPMSFIVGPKNHLTFKNVTSTFAIQLLENKFPDLEKFIALGDESSDIIEVDRKELKDAIGWVAILSESFDSRIDFEIADQRMTLFSELNTSKQKRRIKVNSPIERDFACNPAYFTDFLNAVDDKQVQFFFNEDIKKIFFKSPGATYIITPKK